MSDDGAGAPEVPLELVPRMNRQGYTRPQIDKRRTWLEAKTGVALHHVGAMTLPPESLRGNIENPIGSVQMPLGVAGPLLVNGQHAQGTFYVPFATTEGALVRSYERGMVTLSRAGGVMTRVLRDENRVCPTFVFADVGAAHDFARELPSHFETLRAEAESSRSPASRCDAANAPRYQSSAAISEPVRVAQSAVSPMASAVIAGTPPARA